MSVSSKFTHRAVPLSAALASFLLYGCGGGGGGSSPTPTPASTAPRFASVGSASVVENTAGVFYTAAATDPQGDAITFGISGGPDADKFVIAADGALRFNVPPNYDLPTDADRNNQYSVILRATAGGETTEQTLNVTVTNDREGVRVERVASGLVDPIGMSFVHSTPIVLIAEKGGRVLRFDQGSGSLTEDTFIRDNKRAGQILAIAFGFPDSPFQEATYILTHDAQDGLYLQAFNATSGRVGIRRLGGPSSEPVTASLIAQGSVYAAIGDKGGLKAQDASSPYGKLIEFAFVDPYAGASFPAPGEVLVRSQVIGDGIQMPGGFSPAADFLYLADQGSSLEHELSVFRRDWRPLDFGWPFYEGSKPTGSSPPSAVIGPTIAYAFGNGAKEGTGIIAGLLSDGNFFRALGDSYVFADKSGKIWSIPRAKFLDGFLHFANDIELRTEDFAPDRGVIESPVAFTPGRGTNQFYILDRDGELFVVREAQ